jgi:hypothetical protein
VTDEDVIARLARKPRFREKRAGEDSNLRPAA